MTLVLRVFILSGWFLGLAACGVTNRGVLPSATIESSSSAQVTASPEYLINKTLDLKKIDPTLSLEADILKAQQSPATQISIRTPSPSSTQIPLATKVIQLKKLVTPTNTTCLETKGHYEFSSLKTELLRLPLDFRVYLPRCYDEAVELRYPVLYLFHGQGFKDDQWDRVGADETADQLIAMGEIPPLIIVMPHERYGGQPIESSFGQVLVEELVPTIDRVYRTIANREHRAVGGLSRGGGWAIHFGMRYWETFGALGGHSPAVFFSDAEQMRSMIDSIPPLATPDIYLDIGERDRPEILRAVIWFEQLLNEKSIPHEWHLFSGYHNEDYWKAHMEQYLRWYTGNW